MRGLGHGQVWWADVDTVRPVLVLTRATVAPLLGRVLVAPITTVVRDIPSEVPVGRPEGVRDGSVVNLDNVQLLEVRRLVAPAGEVSGSRWSEICEAMSHTIGC